MNAKTQTKPMLKVERAFNATPEQLWSYWTDPKKYAKWFNPAPIDLVIHEYDVRVGGKVRFDMPQPDGNKNPQEGVFHKLDPYKEILSGAPDKSFLIQVLFVPMGSKMTRMVVNVSGVPPGYHAMAIQGWDQGFDKLERQIGGPAALPKVTGENRGFTIERTFKARPEKVYEMWTTKGGLEKWFTGQGWTMAVSKLDVRVGGRYEFTMKDGTQTIRNGGTYTEVLPNRRLAYLWHFDIFLAPGEKPFDVPISIDLVAVKEGTKMTFKEGPLATAEHTEGSRQGVLANFDRLAKVLEG